MTRHFLKIILALTAVSAPCLAAPAQHTALDKAFQSSQVGPQYAFHMTYKDNEVDVEAYVNPSRKIGERVDVIRPTRDNWNDNFKSMVKAFDAKPLDEFWCADFLTLVGTDAHPVLEVGNATVFAFTPQAAPHDDASDHMFLSEMIAHLTIDRETGFIQKFEMRNRKPFKPMFIAKIKSFRMEALCQASPDGRPYIAQLTTDLSGKIALKKIEEHEYRVISNLSFPP